MAEGTRGRNGRFERSLDTPQRDAKAAELRTRGLTYQEIAKELRLASKAKAYEAVQRALLAAVREPAEELRTLELLRLDELSARAWAIVEAEHPRVDHARTIRHPDTGETLTDPMPVLRAIDRLIRISERRCKLLGLDAPKRIEAISMSDVDAEIERLLAEIGAQGEQTVMDEGPADEGHGERR